MGTRQDAKSKVDKLQAKLTARENEREARMKAADKLYSDACAAARREQTASKKKTEEDLDPAIVDLKKQIKTAKRDLTPPQMLTSRKFGLRAFEE